MQRLLARIYHTGSFEDSYVQPHGVEALCVLLLLDGIQLEKKVRNSLEETPGDKTLFLR